jgi:hypothetical protein
MQRMIGCLLNSLISPTINHIIIMTHTVILKRLAEFTW